MKRPKTVDRVLHDASAALLQAAAALRSIADCERVSMRDRAVIGGHADEANGAAWIMRQWAAEVQRIEYTTQTDAR